MYTPSLREENGKVVGFTLLELLIVIGIMVILGTILVLILNPAETLKKSRDNQRISDLGTLKRTIGLYISSTVSPKLDNTDGNTTCKGGTGTDTVYYSISNSSAITDTGVDGATPGQVLPAYLATTAGLGWTPINFSGMTGGSPISSLPIDPTNTISTLSDVKNTDLVYRYMCKTSDLTFELGARLESEAYATSKMTNDGGDNNNYYEAGTNLSILDGSVSQY